MSKNVLDEFDNEIENFLKTDANYEATTEFVKKHIGKAYYGFLSNRVKIKVKGNEKLLYEYEINKDDPLALLRFYHQSKRTQEELPKKFDELILFLNSKHHGVAQQIVHPTDTISSLKEKKRSLGDEDDTRWFFSFEPPHDKRQGKMTKDAKGKGGKKRKIKKKKKAFPSRKKNNRKNRTKKKTLSK